MQTKFMQIFAASYAYLSGRTVAAAADALLQSECALLAKMPKCGSADVGFPQQRCVYVNANKAICSTAPV